MWVSCAGGMCSSTELAVGTGGMCVAQLCL